MLFSICFLWNTKVFHSLVASVFRNLVLHPFHRFTWESPSPVTSPSLYMQYSLLLPQFPCFPCKIHCFGFSPGVRLHHFSVSTLRWFSWGHKNTPYFNNKWAISLLWKNISAHQSYLCIYFFSLMMAPNMIGPYQHQMNRRNDSGPITIGLLAFGEDSELSQCQARLRRQSRQQHPAR
jgi:hypothetical protein